MSTASYYLSQDPWTPALIKLEVSGLEVCRSETELTDAEEETASAKRHWSSSGSLKKKWGSVTISTVSWHNPNTPCAPAT